MRQAVEKTQTQRVDHGQRAEAARGTRATEGARAVVVARGPGPTSAESASSPQTPVGDRAPARTLPAKDSQVEPAKLGRALGSAAEQRERSAQEAWAPKPGREGRGSTAAAHSAAAVTGVAAAGPRAMAPPRLDARTVPLPVVESPAGGEHTVAAPDVAAAALSGVGPQGGKERRGPEPQMPAVPLQASPAERSRVTEAQGRAGRAAGKVASVPDAAASVRGARDAVAEPKEQAQAQAAAGMLTDLSEREPASPEIIALCERIRQIIRDKRPPDEDSLVKAKPEEMAKDAGESQQAQVQGEVQRAADTYTGIKETPQGSPAPAASELPNTPSSVETPEILASAAMPDAVPAASVSLDADVQSSAQQIDAAGMNTEAAQAARAGAEPGNPLHDAAAAQGSLDTLAKEDPAKVLAAQQRALATANSDMAALQAQAKQSLLSARGSHVQGSATQQRGMKQTEEARRQQAGRDAEAIFTSAQSKVQALLTPLADTALKKWQTHVDLYAKAFKDRLRKVEDWISERHKDVLVSIYDAVAGLPDWVSKEYDAAEKDFGDQITTLVIDISRDVNTVIKTCQDLIAQARKDIAAVFAQFGDDQTGWAAAEQGKFETKLNALDAQVAKSRDDFNKQLSQRASSTIQEARQQIAALREAAKGLLGQLADALNEFAKDPAKFILNGLLKLVGIQPADFWTLVHKIEQAISDIAADPKRFGNNLLKGIGDGFQLFFDNFGKHLLSGFLDWLLSGIRKEGLPLDVPTEITPAAIVKFLLQILGISWARVRKLLAEQLGEENVARLEKAAGLIATLVSEGLDGIVKLLKDAIDPQKIVETIIETGIRFLVETLIVKAVEFVISMVNPAGAIYQAVRAIYKILSWIFRNAARIFKLLEAVVNGIADVVAGNVAGMAKTVERALAMLIAPVIDFIAGLIGLDGLPGKIAQALKSLHAMVEAALRSVIKFLVDQGKKLLAKLGLGGKEPEKAKKQADAAAAIGESVSFGVNKEHTLWIKTEGGKATVMASSDPAPLTTWLDGLEKQLSTLAPESKASAEGLLAKARQLLTTTDQQADQLAASATQTTTQATTQSPDAAKAKNESVKKEEHTLAGVLSQLATLFNTALPAFPSTAFTVDESRYVLRIAAKQGLTPELEGKKQESVAAFLKSAETSTAISKAKKDQIPAAHALLDALKAKLDALTQAKKTDQAPDQAKLTEILQAEDQLSQALQKILKDVDIKKFDERYRMEGMVGSYANLKSLQTSDKMTPDHQPQHAILDHVATLPLFKGTRMRRELQGRSENAWSINLYAVRHEAGRTYGGKGTATKNEAIRRIEAILGGSPLDEKQKRANVISVLRLELAADVAAMKSVVARGETDAVWHDITELKDLSKDQQTALVQSIRAQVISGEAEIAGQDLDRLAEP